MMVSVSMAAQTPFSSGIDRKSVSDVCTAVSHWQIAHHGECRHNVIDWTNGALYRGMFEWGTVGMDPSCLDFIREIGESVRWNMHTRTYHADDICVGQAFIQMYRLYGDEAMIKPARERAWWVATHPSDAPLNKLDVRGKDERWSWSDALFMAPPVYAALYSITGEKAFADYLDNEFAECVDSLYDKDEHLFYRDIKRIPLREPNGAKQFWGRGNGWVFGGLPLVIKELPANHPTRQYYIDLFMEMAAKVVAIQDEKGAWHSSLLDPGSYPLPENSASAFFCYGLAWGINNGYLHGKAYKNAMKKAWESLVSAVSAEGKLGYIQPVGAAPKGEVGIESTDVYGVGAFLLAGSEIYKQCRK